MKRLASLMTVMVLACLGITSTTHAQIDGHAYAIAYLTGAIAFKQLYPAFAKNYLPQTVTQSTPPQDPGQIMVLLSKIPWSIILLVYAYQNAFNKSKIQRDSLFAYLKPLIPTIGKMVAATLVIALLDQFF